MLVNQTAHLGIRVIYHGKNLQKREKCRHSPLLGLSGGSFGGSMLFYIVTMISFFLPRSVSVCKQCEDGSIIPLAA